MSGHSKWATIKRAKAKTDAARGRVFTKIIREISTAAKVGGGDPAANPRLRLSIDKAKAANMPNDNIKRAIEKGVGGGGEAMEELTYEGFGPGGFALLVNVMTDNRNRAAGDIRNIFDKHGGNLGSSGSVSYLFNRRGSIVLEKAGIDEDNLTLSAIDAGAEDISSEENSIEVITLPENFEKVKNALQEAGFKPVHAGIGMIPTTTVKLTGETAQKALTLVGLLEDHDDVQDVFTNFDISEEELEKAE
ncbi:transcriptional regulator [candidate division WOR-1 bacterium RIFOXYA12_FULL_52_29]|uniref:Probable transcriptional regulatory protein A3K49_01265 n=1 Tax=candidate division WOR-1 bacterium RIFOXYC12_FULL_54_18 TaxID=1802584 RepID=A0A1F4T521_UNCSA|nr:MAG: transcriptional regulator [candidate division WOR-1 bacterium RIFOXYA2_FULL_51_19]OGC17220.1 MAG: transcriptional regulator [candidate division WOR-1 bacterium RIFOXYA12_FULL_52_29]OGC26080.1 MAG: transcriptional regulator [candidate division WOR-1 bacterium RIFOXYB2_FULL_45_9]OGC27637.1 MAG: transcriptional regulator [candidate division WOR-1 bacterium RIFOXYC12_FULL_54_18]OGC29149.1 MAG: transcriptional regulator [candidate division WOR-1 bacterium RIFOXYB12_FULL_52_16]